jgi:hypothetical protein
MKIALLGLVSLLAACSTAVPVTQSFPDAPAILMEKCPELKIILGEKVSIMDFTKTVSENYTTYYECSAKNNSWQEWYVKQKKIWDDAQ